MLLHLPVVQEVDNYLSISQNGSFVKAMGWGNCICKSSKDGETYFLRWGNWKYDWLIQLFLVHRSLYNDQRAGQMKCLHTSTFYMLFVIYMLTMTVLANNISKELYNDIRWYCEHYHMWI